MVVVVRGDEASSEEIAISLYHHVIAINFSPSKLFLHILNSKISLTPAVEFLES